VLLRKKPYLLFSAFLLAVLYCFGQLQAFQVIAPDKKTAQGKTTAQIEPFASFQRKIPGDSKPIRVDADSISSWSDKSKYYLLLKGHVFLEQSVLQIRGDQALIVADIESYKMRGIWELGMYVDGNVKIDSSAEVRNAKTAFIDLATRGEFRFNAVKSKVEQKDCSVDPLFKAAQEGKAKAIAEQQKSQKIIPEKVISPAKPSEEKPKPVSQLPPENVPEIALPVVAPVAPALVTTAYQNNPVVVPGNPAPVLQNPLPGTVQVTPPIGIPGGITLPITASGIDTPARQYSVSPRGSSGFNIRMEPLENGEQAVIVSGGVIMNVKDVAGIGLVDIEADRLVIWTKGANPQEIIGNLKKQTNQSGKELELYLSGHVEVRQQDPAKPGNKKGPDAGEVRIIRADEVYYDIGRNTAVALNGELEFYQPKLTDPLFVRAKEIQQLAANQYKVVKAEVFSSKMPADPGLKIYVAEATIEERTIPKFSIFGKRFVDRDTEQELDQKESYVRAKNMFIELENFPIFYLPYLQGDGRDPLGPIEGVNLGFNNIFGGQFGLTLNAFDLLGIQPYENTRWRFDIDYLTKRGPGLGSDFDYLAPDFFGIKGKVNGLVKVYGIIDNGPDNLGGGRTVGEPHPEYRGRILWRQGIADMSNGFTFLGQAAGISDRNYIEQFFKPEWDNGINQDTWAYLRQTDQNMGWYVMGEVRTRPWINETNWLPRLDGFILGQPIFDIFTSSTWGGAAYANLLITNDGTPVVSPLTDVENSTGRFNISEELSAPFNLGGLKIAPYIKGDLALYTNDLSGDTLGRAWGGGGIRASLPFTAAYPEFKSDLFNVNGINHKVVNSINYFNASSSAQYSNFAQLDRLNDDASDQALRDIRNQPTIYPNAFNSNLLTTNNPYFDPQIYAIRRNIDTRIDTLNQIQVIQGDIRQRLQTKRGFPGSQHVVDWMVLDLSGSFFPEKNTDNFGNYLAFLQYDYLWNIGDRTSFTSTGWIDPMENGARVFTLGGYLNRSDRTNFYLGYRSIEPVESKALSGAATYIFSPKYAVTASSTYDFATFQSVSNSLVLTRVGTDLQVSLGFTYNAMQDNFGFTFEILPTIASGGGRYVGPSSNFSNNGSILAR
jgi:hypothetical protein